MLPIMTVIKNIICIIFNIFIIYTFTAIYYGKVILE